MYHIQQNPVANFTASVWIDGQFHCQKQRETPMSGFNFPVCASSLHET